MTALTTPTSSAANLSTEPPAGRRRTMTVLVVCAVVLLLAAGLASVRTSQHPGNRPVSPTVSVPRGGLAAMPSASGDSVGTGPRAQVHAYGVGSLVSADGVPDAEQSSGSTPLRGLQPGRHFYAARSTE